MGKYLDSTGLSYLWNKVKTNLDEKADITDLSNVVAEEITDITAPGGVDSPTVEQIVAQAREGLVEQVSGKGLSANDYTNDDKAKLSALPTKAELDSSLGAKLDKSKWDEEHEQFTIKGYFLGKRGNINVVDNESSGITPLLPLSKTYPIVLKNVLARGTAVALCFYDAAGSFISYPEGIENLNGDFTVSADKYPASACYFIACSEKAGSTYTNGPSVESREGAVSEAIQAAITAAVDEALIERAEACGVVYNRKTGYFSHNGIDDLTAAEVSDMLTHVNEIFLPGGRRLQNLRARTNIVTASSYSKGWNVDYVNLDGVCGRNQYIEVLKIGDCQVGRESVLACFGYECRKLRKVIGELDIFNVSEIRNAFVSVSCLEEITLYGLKVSISFADCPLLSLASLQYLVTNAANTSAITVTVHPTVYAKLTDESNTEWNAVLTAAEAKNINFATTE